MSHSPPSAVSLGKGEVSALAGAGLRVGVYGALGRMGQMVVRTLLGPPESSADATAALVSAIVPAHSPYIGRDIGPLVGLGTAGVSTTADLAYALSVCQVIIDFSAPAASAILAPVAAETGVALVVGTTGLHQAAISAITDASRRIPVVRSANMSLGVNVLIGLLRKASAALPEYDAEIVELHHRYKKDAPSGTALMLAEAVEEGRGRAEAADTIFNYGRSGTVGPRPKREVGVMALRGGDVIGEHTAMLLSSGERIELTHRATNRNVFARGAIRAARWVVEQDPGLYDMEDVLGLS